MQDLKAWLQMNAVFHQHFQNIISASINSLNGIIVLSTEKLSLQK